MSEPSSETTGMQMIPIPSKEILETLGWALMVGEHEFYTSTEDKSDLLAAREWLDCVEAVQNVRT